MGSALVTLVKKITSATAKEEEGDEYMISRGLKLELELDLRLALALVLVMDGLWEIEAG